ncbi:hypothetical protein O7M46_10200 [Bisgaard Taxon 45]|uniref:Uncharacterized protein n=1 Tax=Bisgaard Taxon 45 TaxID=304289 RepID=A0ABT9KJF2_9PAST|nr:hypothetical protein [Bisgaard Taxon 45]
MKEIWYLGGKPLIPYKSGSLSDLLVESFVGTHGMLGGQIWGWYDKQGKTNTLQRLADTTTAVAISVAAPFAVSDLISPDVMEILFK